MSKFLLRLLVSSIALYVAVRLVPGISYEGGWQVLVGMALIFGVVNAIVRPIVSLLTCPLIILTMGLFIFVINGLMLVMASRMAEILGVTFYVRGFGSAIWGAVVISIVSLVMNTWIADEDEHKEKD
jgi:putative membrane protein